MSNSNQRNQRKTYGRYRPSVIRNRDIPVLLNIIPTMKLVDSTERTLDWQHDKMLNISQHMNGMPGGGSMPKGIDDALALLSEAGAEHAASIMQYLRELREAEGIINGIKSRSMRAFVVMKYVMDISDAEIRRELNMSEWGFKQARRCIEQADSMNSVIWTENFL